ncbi:MAG: bifunctional enoyl-CoA hydratase/phosphate acetyltransferase [Rhodospirillales bacterium]
MLSTAPFEVPQYLLDRAKGLDRVPMAVAGSDNMVVMESARQATEAGLITPVLVGDRGEIESLAETMGWDISAYRIVDTGGEDESAAARAAVTLARDGEVKALMKGHVHTDALMAAVVARETGLRTGRRLSHVFHMTVPGSDRVLMITDGAVNVAPNENTLMDIVNNAVGLAHALGNAAPKVAILSGTESALPAMPSSMTAKAIVERARAGEVSGAVVDGPFAFDNAVSPEAARFKGIDSPVAGNDDILVVPNI